MDLVLKLRELRRMRGLTQKDVARLSGIGVKTISSFETGERIGSLKFAQLERLLAVYGVTPKEFFGRTVEKDIAAWQFDEDEVAERRLLEEVGALPKPLQRTLFAQFELMVKTAAAVYGNHLVPQPGTFEQEHSRSSRY
ncbi:MAG TPA: helix-turn-helix transcriptional regulator [Thermoanaerobaculia bacterium]|nr:helix-turn-helix transcriptional regulator [Thermoanaerobaculia bacterium]